MTSWDSFHIKTTPSGFRPRKASKSLEVIKEGSIPVPIYVHTNIIPQREPQPARFFTKPCQLENSGRLSNTRARFIRELLRHETHPPEILRLGESPQGSRAHGHQTRQRRNRGTQTHGWRFCRLHPRMQKLREWQSEQHEIFSGGDDHAISFACQKFAVKITDVNFAI